MENEAITEIVLCAPARLTASTVDDLAAAMCRDVANHITPEIETIVVTMAKPDNAEFRADLVTRLKSRLSNHAEKITTKPIEEVDHGEEMAVEAAEAQAKLDREGELIEKAMQSLIDGMAEMMADAQKKSECGCPFCVLNRRAHNIPEPDEYDENGTPSENMAALPEDEWKRLDALHAAYQAEGRIPFGERPPSEVWKSSRIVGN